nr:immunoglobulin alpha Fc receptor isoform X1 [Microcebus murinus]
MACKDTTILLCLVLCLGQRIQAQEGDFPVPVISAEPGSVIPCNGSVKIQCRGTPESYLYRLVTLRNSTYVEVDKKLGISKEAEFILSRVDEDAAGRYRCRYKKQFSWSEYSEALELVVTGLYDKPFLSADRGLVLRPGDSISLECGSAHTPFDRFSLAREGEASLPLHGDGGHQGNFTLGPVDAGFAGHYRCYGWRSGSPYLWSAPSDALELVVTDSMHQDYTVGNLIRMGVAGLVLVALLAILAEHRHSHTVPHKEGWPHLAEPSWRKQKCQTEWTLGQTSSGHRKDRF